MKKAYAHIGMPKTGTTAIQISLSSIRQILKRNGLLYPGDRVDHAYLIAIFHHAGPRHFHFQNRGIAASDALAGGNSLIESIRCDTRGFEGDILVSSEYLSGLRPGNVQKLDEFFNKAGFELNIICYVRHPVSLAVSTAQQNVKTGASTLAEMIENPRWHSLIETLQPSLEVLGRERIIVRRHEDAKSIGTAKDILQAIGYSGPLGDVPKIEANSSLSMPAVLLVDAHRRLAGYFPVLNRYRRHLLRVGGPRFSLPEKTLDKVRKAARRELEWLDRNFGIALKEPSATGTTAGQVRRD